MPVLRTKDGALTERVARALLGAPSGIDPESGQVKFGDITVNIATGRFFDFDDESSGTHLDLIRRFKAVENGQAEAWLKENITEAKSHPLPQEGLAERALLGMLSMRPELLAAIEEEVTVDHFGEMVHKQLFAGIAAADTEPDKPVSMKVLMDACGGDPLLPVTEGFTLSRYVATIVAEAPSAPDAAHLARTLAAEIRSAANREGDVQDEYDIAPEPPPFVSQFGGIPFEMLDEPGPEHAHIIDGLITVGDKSVVGGPSKSGKSFLAIHMAMCIGTGMAFFDRRILTPGLVIYQAGEGGRGIKKRFRAWRQHFGIPKGRKVPLFILQSKVDIHSHEGDTSKLIAEVQGVSKMYGMPLVALFIDTLAKASGAADENSGRDMGTVMANVDRIAEAVPGCHVCLVHHMNAGGTKLRGHTSVYAGVDQVILVTKDEEAKMSTAVLDKQKDDEDGAKILFELMQVEIGRRAIDGKPITSCVTLPLGGQLEMRVKGTATDRTTYLSDDQTNIFRALKEALGEVGIPTPPSLKLPRSITKVCTVTDWYNSYRAVSSKEDTAIRKAMGRASDKFIKLRIIGRINPYVWVTNRAVADVPGVSGNLAGGYPVQEEFPEQGDMRDIGGTQNHSPEIV